MSTTSLLLKTISCLAACHLDSKTIWHGLIDAPSADFISEITPCSISVSTCFFKYSLFLSEISLIFCFSGIIPGTLVISIGSMFSPCRNCWGNLSLKKQPLKSHSRANNSLATSSFRCATLNCASNSAFSQYGQSTCFNLSFSISRSWISSIPRSECPSIPLWFMNTPSLKHFWSVSSSIFALPAIWENKTPGRLSPPSWHWFSHCTSSFPLSSVSSTASGTLQLATLTFVASPSKVDISSISDTISVTSCSSICTPQIEPTLFICHTLPRATFGLISRSSFEKFETGIQNIFRSESNTNEGM